jgi:hypothetical protein
MMFHKISIYFQMFANKHNTGFSYVFNIFVPRRVKNVLHLRIVDLLTLLIVLGVVISFIYTSIRYRPQQPVSKDWKSMVNSGITDLSSEANCRCSNTNFYANQAYHYKLNDSDYTFCNGEFMNVSGYWGSVTCITSTYELYGLINEGQWTITSTSVLTYNQLQASINDQIATIVFAIGTYKLMTCLLQET